MADSPFLSSLFSIHALKWRVGIHAPSGGFTPLPTAGEPGPRLLQVEVLLYANPRRHVDRIALFVRRPDWEALPTDWQPQDVDLERQQFVYCPLPDWLQAGPYRAQLVAYGGKNERTVSQYFVLEVPE